MVNFQNDEDQEATDFKKAVTCYVLFFCFHKNTALSSFKLI